ncbi:MAG: alcohol dehydrogenase [Cyanobacteria bacterium SW_12_48_29]|jgi:alcohol dehydrogenase/propanol-preferring alcohol dehydrogenase|nr:MAG: alcohol dehydrogenase [Cyanobacteria bacterium QH_10_48_56]PSO92555.1 MAG: alcohol dehydrogenase [Cyanobacteria bacterium QS_9_48_30]PSP04426.1 MAG: alcohol dehydrogenase [Cyanobacteria bacterium SW_12_48_29]PSP20537.1 MAG: alcohol dehydrogenase [Cyanobacteria bacterium SW_5_48_44]
MSAMKAVQVSEAGGDFELVQREIPQPERGEVRIKVEACGICHSDEFVKEGTFPGISYPRIPGHEIAGYVDQVGEGVSVWQQGQRVGVGWHGGHCFVCPSCRAGDFINCEQAEVTGISYDGGYAEYVVVPQEALASLPEELKAVDAAPLLCAGVTTYNSLRNAGAKGGDVVAVLGIGGLGHLAVQFASKLGFRTVAISGTPEKKDLAFELGATHYLDPSSVNVAEELSKMGGARVILATAPNSAAITSVLDGLGRDGTLLVVGVSGEPIEVSPLQLIMGRKSILGWPSGHAKDSEETLNFSALGGIGPQIETFPLERISEAYEQMISNKARFRVVLTMG